MAGRRTSAFRSLPSAIHAKFFQGLLSAGDKPSLVGSVRTTKTFTAILNYHIILAWGKKSVKPLEDFPLHSAAVFGNLRGIRNEGVRMYGRQFVYTCFVGHAVPVFVCEAFTCG